MNYIKRWCTSPNPSQRGSFFYLGYFGVMGIFLPFLNLYFRQELGFSGRQIGLLSIFPPLMTLLIAIPIASLADRRRWRIPIMIGAITGFGVILLVAGFPHSFLVWMVLRPLMSFFASPISPLADSVIARMSIRHNLNYGSMRLWGSFSFALTAIVGGILWERIGFGAMFVIAGIAFFPVLFFASRLEEEPFRPEREREQSFREIRRDVGLVVLVVASFLVGASVYISIVFDGIYMNYLGGTQVLVGLMFGLSAFSELPTMQYREVIARCLSGPKTLLLAYGMFVVAFLGYTIAWQPGVLLFMGMVKGLGFGLFQASTVRLASERVPENWASTIQSIVNASAFGLAPLLASPLGGEVYDRFGPEAVFICASLLVGAAALVLAFAIIKGIFTDVEAKPAVMSVPQT